MKKKVVEKSCKEFKKSIAELKYIKRKSGHGRNRRNIADGTVQQTLS